MRFSRVFTDNGIGFSGQALRGTCQRSGKSRFAASRGAQASNGAIGVVTAGRARCAVRRLGHHRRTSKSALLARRRRARARNDENPCEAIAILVHGRYLELDGVATWLNMSWNRRTTLIGRRSSIVEEWEWNLYGDLHHYVNDGDPEIFQSLIESAPLNLPSGPPPSLYMPRR